MKVTKILAQVKTRGRYSIFVDEKFAFGMSELGLIESGLRVGQELTSEQVESLRDQSKLDKIYGRLLDLVMRRPRSRWEIEDYLRRKGHEPELSEALIAKLSGKGFIEDEDFARRWVENRRLLKSISMRKLAVELRQKRISDDIIRAVLEADTSDEVDVIRTEIAKKRRQSRYADNQKLIAYLARQGYRYDDIKAALQTQDN